MKVITLFVSVVGVLGLFLAAAAASVTPRIAGITSAGYLRGSTALFLLALVIMAYGKLYCSKEKP